MNLLFAGRLGLVEFNSTYIMNVINAIVMFLIMKKFLFVPIQKMLREREEEIKKQYSDAQKAEDEAVDLKTKYESKLADVDVEGAEILKDYKTRAESSAHEIIKHAETEAQKIKEKGLKELDTEIKKANHDLKDQISELSILAASKVIDKELNPKDHEDILNKIISEVGDVNWQS